MTTHGQQRLRRHRRGRGSAQQLNGWVNAQAAGIADRDPAVLLPESGGLRGLASRVINEHVDDCGLCAVCGSAFPCGLAVLAEHNLDLL